MPLKPLDPSKSWIEGYPSLIHASWFLDLPCLQNTTCLVSSKKKTLVYTDQPTTSSRPADHPLFQPQIIVFYQESENL